MLKNQYFTTVDPAGILYKNQKNLKNFHENVDTYDLMSYIFLSDTTVCRSLNERPMNDYDHSDDVIRSDVLSDGQSYL